MKIKTNSVLNNLIRKALWVVHKRRPHKIAKNWPSPLIRADTP